MNDYLYNLAARTLGAAPLIKPRLASVFEPSSQADLTVAEETTSSAQAQLEAEAVKSTTAANQLRSESSASAIKAPPAPREAVQFRPRAGLPPPMNDKALNVAEAAQLTRQAAAQLPEPPLFRRAAELSADVEAGESSATKNAQAAAIQIRPSITLPAASGPTGEVMKAEPGTDQTAKEAAPVIRISIGRVEVRAVMPTAPAPRPAPARPRPGLSLDDYLKEREGGKR